MGYDDMLLYFADIDSLTGIRNRRGFLHQAEYLITATAIEQWAMSILILDIDYFKKINDEYSSVHGDKFLQSATKVFSSLLRKSDLIGHLGGDEFAVLLCNTTLDDAERIAERMRLEVANTTFSSPIYTLQITISIGLAALEPQETVETALKKADEAVYLAKGKGRNRVERYQP